MQIATYFLQTSIFMFILVNILFLISLRIKRNDIADIFWGLGGIAACIFNIVLSGKYSSTKIIILALIILWGLRLAGYITIRNFKKSEDFRYKKWKQKWGKGAILKSYFQVYLLQGLLIVLVSSSAGIYLRFGGNVNFWSFLGILIWTAGFVIETVADIQKYLFKNKPVNENKFITHGLWKYSRHPNYFGEVMMWWGIWILTIGSIYWMFSIIAPLTISYLIIFVSGIPLLENKYINNMKYQKYKKRTSAFLLLPPKTGKIN